MSDNAIRVLGIGKRYRKGFARQGSLIDSLRLGRGREYFWALKDVSFDVKRGELLGVVGPNGAGKSTLLRILSRITRPNEGRAEIYGRLGSLLEVGTGFHPELSGRENIYLNGALLGMRRAEIQRNFDAIVDYSGIEAFLDTPIKRYSSGMKVRLGFAVAAHLNQEILLVDEVLAVGDAAFREKSINTMQRVTHEGRTVVLVGHNLSIISSNCHRAVWLDRAKVKAEGKAPEIVQSYLEATFADIGSRDGWIRLDGRSDQEDEAKFLLTHIRFLDHEDKQIPHFRTGQRVKLAIGYRADNKVSLDPVTVSLTILNQNQHSVAVCDSSLAREPLHGTSPVGEFLCEFEKLPLMPGFYKLNVKCTVGTDVVQHIPNAGAFHVVEGDFFRTGQLPTAGSGDFLIEHHWSIKESPS